MKKKQKYRMLDIGEEILPTDEAYTWIDPECTKLGWTICNISGETVNENTVPIRRLKENKKK